MATLAEAEFEELDRRLIVGIIDMLVAIGYARRTYDPAIADYRIALTRDGEAWAAEASGEAFPPET